MEFDLNTTVDTESIILLVLGLVVAGALIVLLVKLV